MKTPNQYKIDVDSIKANIARRKEDEAKIEKWLRVRKNEDERLNWTLATVKKIVPIPDFASNLKDALDWTVATLEKMARVLGLTPDELFAGTRLVETVERYRVALLPKGETRGGRALCYCSLSDYKILRDICNVRIPDHALVNNCCWKRICQVRGRNYNNVDSETWSEICRERGYFLRRANPRGF